MGSDTSGSSGDSEIVGFDWSYQSRIRKWYFVTVDGGESRRSSETMFHTEGHMFACCIMTIVLEEAEIDEIDSGRVIGTDKDVAWLDVTMYIAVRMDVLEPQ